MTYATQNPTGTVRMADAEKMLAPMSRAQIREAVKRGYPRGSKFMGTLYINLEDIEECAARLRNGEDIDVARKVAAASKNRKESLEFQRGNKAARQAR